MRVKGVAGPTPQSSATRGMSPTANFHSPKHFGKGALFDLFAGFGPLFELALDDVNSEHEAMPNANARQFAVSCMALDPPARKAKQIAEAIEWNEKRWIVGRWNDALLSCFRA